MMQQGSISEKEISVEEVRKAISLQIAYIQENTDKIVNSIGNACASWAPQQKGSVPALLSVYIADEVFEDHP